MACLVSGVYQYEPFVLENFMSASNVTVELLKQLRRVARSKSRQDKSKTFLQWLDHLCRAHGGTYTSLKRRVEELAQLAHANALAEEDRIWMARLAESRVWGAVPSEESQGWPLPPHELGTVPWPHCFATSNLFGVGEYGPKVVVAESLLSLDEHAMTFHGERLRVHPDQTFFMAFILKAGSAPCGELFELSMPDLEATLGCSLSKRGMPIEPASIERTLWRLTNCRLTCPEFQFDGPLLTYADARQAPDLIRFALHPALGNFFSALAVALNRGLQVDGGGASSF